MEKWHVCFSIVKCKKLAIWLQFHFLNQIDNELENSSLNLILLLSSFFNLTCKVTSNLTLI